MTISELQQWVKNDWEKNSKHTPSVELQLLYIMEELGEVAEAIRKSDGLKSRDDRPSDLGSELADLYISITTLANHFDVDLTKELQLFQDRITARHGAGH